MQLNLYMQSKSKEPESISRFKPEDRAEILNAAVEIENIRNPQANISVVNFSDLSTYIRENADKERYRAIIGLYGHYIAADWLQKAGEDKTCILIDAALDGRYYAVLSALENEHGYTVLSPCGFFNGNDGVNLQSDSASCSMFALDHCTQLAHFPDSLHGQLRQELNPDEGDTFTWDRMPPCFICNAQSLRTIKKYMDANPTVTDEPMPNGMTLREYITSGTGLSDGLEPVPANNSIHVHVFKKALSSFHATRAFELGGHVQDRREELDEGELGEDLTSSSSSSTAAVRESPSAQALRGGVQELRAQEQREQESKTSDADETPTHSSQSKSSF